ncbi:putative ABC transporter ATP-binding protein YjjK [Escherichia coli]|uniref:Putative ABC transporter ATP-binding protein YjjK n=1 Tax=Escherichia coli TaxID=562 RepID=A0A376MR19_ECOLX|nr:putative ABC transporter ATP-binding protein YjjK [Escherichia coli]
MRCVCRTGTRKSLTSPVVSVVAWRCAACCWKNQTCCCSTNRRTHLDAESVAWLERFLHDFEGTVGGDYPRPLLPR